MKLYKMFANTLGASEPDQLNERDMRDAAVLIEEFGMPVVRIV